MFNAEESISKIFRKLDKELPGVSTENVTRILLAGELGKISEALKPQKKKVINVLVAYPESGPNSLGYVCPPDEWDGNLQDLWRNFQNSMDIEETNNGFIPFLVENYGFTKYEFDDFSHITLNSD